MTTLGWFLLELSLFIGLWKVNYGGSKRQGVPPFPYLVLKLKIGWVAFSDEIYYLALISQSNISILFEFALWFWRSSYFLLDLAVSWVDRFAGRDNGNILVEKKQENCRSLSLLYVTMVTCMQRCNSSLIY